jgi:hypothetical protein
MKGVVSEANFIKAQLTLETDGDHLFISLIEFSLVNLSNGSQITVPIHFIMKTHNTDLDDFKVLIISSEKKGFWAILYGLSPNNCIIGAHGQSRMSAK